MAAQSSQTNVHGQSQLASMTSSSANPIFLTAPNYNSGGQDAFSIAVADVNGDGKPDLVVANGCSYAGDCPNGAISVLLGNGDGTFQTAVNYGSGGVEANSIAVADVNGDGKPDIVVANLCNDGFCTTGSVGVLLGNGDGTFQAAVSYGSGGKGGYSVAVADLNRDGKLDLVVANECGNIGDDTCSDGTLDVLLGNGDGTFRAAVGYDLGGVNPVSVVVGDVNGDGKLDLVAADECSTDADCSSGTVSVLIGNGDGTFQAPVNYASGGETATSIAVADVNGDGKLDLIVANACFASFCSSVDSVNIMLGNGDGTFRAPVSYASGGTGNISVAVADVNGDGKPDIVVANLSDHDSGVLNGSVGVLAGNGDGTFRPVVNYGSAGFLTSSIAVADVNGDGKLDLLVTNQCENAQCSAGTVAVLLGTGDGAFLGAANYGSGGQAANSVAVADLNRDGKLDLVVANFCAVNTSSCPNGEVGVLLGNGDGTFQTAVSYAAGLGAFSVAVGDVNGDGIPDIVVTNLNVSHTDIDGGVTILLGIGDGTFQAAGVTYDTGAENALSVVIADVNGDGKPDLVVTNQCRSSTDCSAGTMAILLGNGDGTFQAAQIYLTSGEYGFSIAVADVNGDGKPDLVVANSCTSSGNCSAGIVGVLLGNGDGTFQPAVEYGSGGEYPAQVAVADVNGDGKPDLLVTNRDSLGVLLGNGDGTFQPVKITVAPDLDSGDGPPVVADFNGDGKLDVAVGGVCVLLLGNGDGTFQSPLTVGAAAEGLAVGDFNGDGKPDLVDGGVTVLLNIASNFKYATTTALTSSLNPEPFGQPLTLTAVVTAAFNASALSGNVTFYDGTTALETDTLSGGTATFTTTGLTVGLHSISATYSGDTNLIASSASLSQAVNQSSTTLVLASSVNPSAFDQGVTLTATVSPAYNGTPTGSVTFYNGKAALGTVALHLGEAKFVVSTLSIGTHSLTAAYSGDTDFLSSASDAVTQVVGQRVATVTLGSNLNPSYVNQTVMFSATVAGVGGIVPTGSVKFQQGTDVLSTVALVRGTATYRASFGTGGNRSITAVYSGDINYPSKRSNASMQFVDKYTSNATATTSLNPSAYGHVVTLISQVTSAAPSNPTGTVVFKNGATSLGTAPLVNGIARLTKTNLPAGTFSITATYNGDAANSETTSTTLGQVVSQATTTTTLTSSSNPSTAGKSIKFTATVKSPTTVPIGTVTFTAATTTLGTINLSGGKAVLITSGLPAGTTTVTATYNGTSNIAGSSGEIIQKVN